MTTEKLILRSITAIFVTIVAALTFGVGIFFYDEYHRKQLLINYSAPQYLIESLRVVGLHSAADLMRTDETTICMLDSYSSVGALEDLNERQKKSLPKEKTPSEDMMWYLLFFSKSKVTRIFIVNQYGNNGLDPKNGGCIDIEGHLNVSIVTTGSEFSEFHVSSIKGIKK